MARTSAFPLIAEQQVAASVRLEVVLVLLSVAFGVWVFYKLFLRNISYDRHKTFKQHFRNLWNHLAVGLLFFGIYEFIALIDVKAVWADKAQLYIGLLTIFSGLVIFIKILRIIAFEYLFLTSKKAGVPLLLVNIFTLIASLLLTGWVLTAVFQIDLAPLLATSAAVSIVLGLALQDTLGNLFSAVALQFDKPFDLGDWIEVKNGSEKIVGQVKEISWRSTSLLAITDEIIVLPNRILSQSQISNFAGRERAFVRSHVFRIPHGQPIADAKAALLSATDYIAGIVTDPAPVVIITETTESWITLKVVYNISDYGAQFGIADRYLSQAVEKLREAGIQLATPRLTLDRPAPTLLSRPENPQRSRGKIPHSKT